MIRPSCLMLAGAGLLSAFAAPATAAPRPARFHAPRLLTGPSAALASAAASAGPLAHSKTASWRRRQDKAPSAPLSRVAAANRSAVREPSADDYLGAAQVYPWTEGALYRLYAAPGRVSDIALQPGETLISVAAGDTVRWIVGDTTSGAGAARRTHILVKPSAAGLSTNLVIATDRRVYHVDARSNAHTAMASISWTYPEDALVALRGTAPPADPPSSGVAVDQLNFDYRIIGKKLPWRPIRAFDDGRQVFIEFPATLAQGDAPPLFVTGEDGRAELVNYRIRGLYYVVDRLFTAAELRMGEKHQQVVRIVRGGPDARLDRSAR